MSGCRSISFNILLSIGADIVTTNCLKKVSSPPPGFQIVRLNVPPPNYIYNAKYKPSDFRT